MCVSRRLRKENIKHKFKNKEAQTSLLEDGGGKNIENCGKAIFEVSMVESISRNKCKSHS